MSDLLARLETDYDAVPRRFARVEAYGPFTLFLGEPPSRACLDDWTADSADLKGRLGGVHFRKGESTRREIAYAESLGKPVRYLSRERPARTGDALQE